MRGVDLRAHAHLLRHTFAVITLEQLQRGHIAALAELSPEQRGHYTRIFGDPLDWVRRRLGHSSVVTTQVYLHALAELEMATRMALVPDGWEDPRDTRWPRSATTEPLWERSRPGGGEQRSRRGSTGTGRPAVLPVASYEPPTAIERGQVGLIVGFHGEDGRQGTFRVGELPLPGWHEPLAAAWAIRIGPGGRLRTLASVRAGAWSGGWCGSWTASRPRPPIRPG